MRNVIEIPVTPIESLCIMVEKDCGVKMCMEGQAQEKLHRFISNDPKNCSLYINNIYFRIPMRRTLNMVCAFYFSFLFLLD